MKKPLLGNQLVLLNNARFKSAVMPSWLMITKNENAVKTKTLDQVAFGSEIQFLVQLKMSIYSKVFLAVDKIFLELAHILWDAANQELSWQMKNISHKSSRQKQVDQRWRTRVILYWMSNWEKRFSQVQSLQRCTTVFNFTDKVWIWSSGEHTQSPKRVDTVFFSKVAEKEYFLFTQEDNRFEN